MIAAAALALCLLLLVGIKPAEAAFPGGNGKIAFQSNRNGPVEIYAMTPGGTDTRITTSNNSSDPSYSPDGSKIAFISGSNTNSSYEVFVMNADGTKQKNLTNNAAEDGDPVFSPDGKKIAFYTNRPIGPVQGDAEIWRMRADGTNPVQLTENESITDAAPDWQPIP